MFFSRLFSYKRKFKSNLGCVCFGWKSLSEMFFWKCGCLVGPKIDFRWPKKKGFDYGNEFPFLFSLQMNFGERESERAKGRRPSSSPVRWLPANPKLQSSPTAPLIAKHRVDHDRRSASRDRNRRRGWIGLELGVRRRSSDWTGARSSSSRELALSLSLSLRNSFEVKIGTEIHFRSRSLFFLVNGNQFPDQPNTRISRKAFPKVIFTQNKHTLSWI